MPVYTYNQAGEHLHQRKKVNYKGTEPILPRRNP